MNQWERTQRCSIFLSLLTAILFYFGLSVIAHASGPDRYEPDNDPESATHIQIADPRIEEYFDVDMSQYHNFYDQDDVDWVKFYAEEMYPYTVRVYDAEEKCDAVINIVNKYGVSMLPEEKDDHLLGEEEYAEFICPEGASGYYYARIRQCTFGTISCDMEYGDNTGYRLSVSIPIGTGDGRIAGTITPCNHEKLIIKTTISNKEYVSSGCVDEDTEYAIHYFGFEHNSTTTPIELIALNGNDREEVFRSGPFELPPIGEGDPVNITVDLKTGSEEGRIAGIITPCNYDKLIIKTTASEKEYISSGCLDEGTEIEVHSYGFDHPITSTLIELYALNEEGDEVFRSDPFTVSSIAEADPVSIDINLDPLCNQIPLIGKISDPLTISEPSTEIIYAQDISACKPIEKVIATIAPPNNLPLESHELSKTDTGRYEFSYDFQDSGTYRITLMAIDDIGMPSDPVQTTVTLTEIESYSLYFPHVDCSGSWETEICVINNGEGEMKSTLIGYDDNGSEISSENFTLSPHARKEWDVQKMFSQAVAIKWFKLESNLKDAVGYTKFYIPGQYRVAVPAVYTPISGSVHISHIASNDQWWTGIALINPTDTEKVIEIEFNNGVTKQKSLIPRSHDAFTVRNLFDETMQPDVESAHIRNADGLIGLELFGDYGHDYLSGVLLNSESSTSMIFPHITKSSDPNWWTGIAVYNPNENACNYKITPYTIDGKKLSNIENSLSGNGKYVNTTTAMQLPDEAAWVKVSSSLPVTGFELFGREDKHQLAGYTGVNINGNSGVFPKIEKKGWTGIAFVNLGQNAAEVKLKAFDDAGNIVASNDDLTLNPGEKQVKLAEDLFNSSIVAATYIFYSADQEIVGFQLNGVDDEMMLDGLPALR